MNFNNNNNVLVLNEKQENALSLLRSGKSFFLTGQAGTGKTITLASMIHYCRASNRRFAVTASTGIAAILLGGQTIHAWSGMRLGTESLSRIIGRIMNSPNGGDVRFRIQECQTLFIDEISILKADFFNKLDALCKTVRQNALPFGGIQIVLCGDFFQLGQVNTSLDRKSNDALLVHTRWTEAMKQLYHPAFTSDIIELVNSYWSRTYTPNELIERYVFLSNSWKNCIRHYVFLTKPYRQTDSRFIDLLNRARHACLTKEDDELFRSRIGKEVNPNASPSSSSSSPSSSSSSSSSSHLKVIPLLHPYVKRVQAENEAKLQLLSGQMYSAQSRFLYRTGRHVTDLSSSNNKNHRAYQKAADFAKHLLISPVLKFKIGAPIIIVQNKKNPDIVNGQRGIVTNIFLSPKVSQKWRTSLLKHDIALASQDDVVEVLLENQTQPIRLTRSIFRQAELDSERELEPSQWSRTYEVSQFPFNLCFALTIHKSQGQSLTAARVYLGKDIRSFGQAYVALSRIVDMNGLCVETYDRAAFVTDPVVEDFNKYLLSVCV